MATPRKLQEKAGNSASARKLKEIVAKANLEEVELIFKEIDWLGNEAKLAKLGEEARKLGGMEMCLVQLGHMPTDFKPMAAIGAGAMEVRFQTVSNWVRISYVAKFSDAIYVLDVIEKKTNQTAQQDIDNARDAYKKAVVRSQENARMKSALAKSRVAPKKGK